MTLPHLLFSHWVLLDSFDCTDRSPPGSSVHGISQARIREWVALSFSRASSWPRDWTCMSCIDRPILCQPSHQRSHPLTSSPKFPCSLLPAKVMAFTHVSTPSLADQDTGKLQEGALQCWTRCRCPGLCDAGSLVSLPKKLAVGADADDSASWPLPPGRFPSPPFQSCHLSWLTVLLASTNV